MLRICVRLCQDVGEVATVLTSIRCAFFGGVGDGKISEVTEMSPVGALAGVFFSPSLRSLVSGSVSCQRK